MLPDLLVSQITDKVDAKEIAAEFEKSFKNTLHPSIYVYRNLFLCLAVEHGHLDLVKHIIREGADINFQV